MDEQGEEEEGGVSSYSQVSPTVRVVGGGGGGAGGCVLLLVKLPSPPTLPRSFIPRNSLASKKKRKKQAKKRLFKTAHAYAAAINAENEQGLMGNIPFMIHFDATLSARSVRDERRERCKKEGINIQVGAGGGGGGGGGGRCGS